MYFYRYKFLAMIPFEHLQVQLANAGGVIWQQLTT